MFVQENMSMLSNSKVMLGAALAFLILSAPLSVLSTGAVEDAVDENFETFPTDTACANDDCTEAEADWATDTGERSYYAWNLTILEQQNQCMNRLVRSTTISPTLVK